MRSISYTITYSFRIPTTQNFLGFPLSEKYSQEIKKMLTLKSSDGDEFFLDETIAIQSVTIKNIIGDDCALTVIPLPNITSETLTKVIEFLKKHADSRVSKDDITEFDNKFVSEVDMGAKLFDLILAANYLDITDLLDITCQKVADYIKDKTPEEVRTLLNIENDFTPEEEAKIREENPWAYE